MPANTKKRAGDNVVFGIAYGTLLSFAAVFLILAAAAWLISTERLPESAMSSAAKAAAFLAGAIGGFFAAVRNRSSAMISAAITAAVTAAVRLIAAAFSERGEIFGAQSLWITACIFAGGIIAAAACSGKKRRRRR